MSKKQPKLVPALAVVALLVVLAYFLTDVSIWWLLGAGLVSMVFNFLVEMFRGFSLKDLRQRPPEGRHVQGRPEC